MSRPWITHLFNRFCFFSHSERDFLERFCCVIGVDTRGTGQHEGWFKQRTIARFCYAINHHLTNIDVHVWGRNGRSTNVENNCCYYALRILPARCVLILPICLVFSLTTPSLRVDNRFLQAGKNGTDIFRSNCLSITALLVVISTKLLNYLELSLESAESSPLWRFTKWCSSYKS